MAQIIKEIDNLILFSSDYNEEEPLLQVLGSLIQEYFEHKVVDSETFLFDESNPREIKRFISICFVRLIGTSDDLHFKSKSYMVTKIAHDSIPEVCAVIGINAKSPFYEFVHRMADLIHQREKDFFEQFQFSGELALFNNFQQSYRRCLNNTVNKYFLMPFLNEIVSKTSLDKIFFKIQEYIDAENQNKYTAYNRAKRAIEDFLLEAKELNTEYARISIELPFGEILKAIESDFSVSPYSQPSALRIENSEKKYPLYLGAKNNLRFYVIKEDSGFAFNTIVRVINHSPDNMVLSKPEQFIGEIKTASTIVDFEYEMLKACNAVAATVEVEWNNVDGVKQTWSEEVNIIGQKENIDWAHIVNLQPYNLEPIENAKELIGRERILTWLKGESRNISSSYIYGQRRVGKTSIVKTLMNSNVISNLAIFYIEAGDWDDAQNPFNSMANLGNKICRKIRQYHTKFSSIPIPDFKGSFNYITDFLDQVVEIDPSFKALIILDEFDRISRELYERGDIGRSFVLTIRAISNRSQFGFILVGGEKMEYILSQWQEFNKFKLIRVDYFGKEEDWKDYMNLIRKPVEGILEISDKAIEVIYSKTSGNPYFTKKICMELYTVMMGNRDLHVTRKEAEIAYSISTNDGNIGATDFSHFWEDGISTKAEKEEETSIKRRKVLIAITQLLRNSSKVTKANIADYASQLDLSKDETDRYLNEFERRKVLQFDGTEYQFYVQFFKEWLLYGGVDKIISSFEEEQRLLINKKQEEEAMVKSSEIAELVRNWRSYKGREITSSSVRIWLDQFDDVFDQRLIFKIAKNIKVYHDIEVREKLEDMFKLVKRQISVAGKTVNLIEGKRKRQDILVSYLGETPGKSGSFYTKLFVDQNNIYTDNSCVPFQLEKKLTELRNLNAVVFVDDFIGSGDTLIDNINNFSKELKFANEKGYTVVIGAIAGFYDAKDKIERHLSSLGIKCEVIVVDVLDEQDMAFSTSSRIFDTALERNTAKEICRKKGVLLEKKHPLGFGNRQATIVFPTNCPNNSLPIIWKRTQDWEPLFERN